LIRVQGLAKITLIIYWRLCYLTKTRNKLWISLSNYLIGLVTSK
jgi:hypothetical protein